MGVISARARSDADDAAVRRRRLAARPGMEEGLPANTLQDPSKITRMSERASSSEREWRKHRHRRRRVPPDQGVLRIAAGGVLEGNRAKP
jgi:hypothetical protein